MSSQLKNLTILPMNKTVVFYSPCEGSDVLVRTGTIADGNCFFHSLLHAYSTDYVSMNMTGRTKFVKRLRSSLASNVDIKKWENLSNGLIAKIPFQENVSTILSDFYKYLEKGGQGRSKSVRKIIRSVGLDNDSTKKEIYQLISEMIHIEEFKKTILPSAYEKTSEESLSECKKTVIKFSCSFYKDLFSTLGIEKNKIDFYINKLEILIKYIVDEAEESAYNEYILSLQNTSMEIDSYTVGLISEKFNRDIYFIDSKTRMPYRDINNDNIKKRKSIIVMWTGGSHYEIVGKLLPGNRIQREFPYSDHLIKCIHTYLIYPEKIPDKYPNLVSYLSKDIRKNIGVDLSDSEDDRIQASHRSNDEDGRNITSSDNDYENSSAYEKSDSENSELEGNILNKKVNDSSSENE